ncbi:DUF7344 domain-containing protein [Halegenticoccus tardaugens]|uniref:DUF7344 domain-containing protein n=1 Tax=Halegenticoccus tardaugens TaxID=2071624 RepID=UPI00100C08DF|nr:ArsR family transcriptional regulator [Halegenticoccus tardaugens]
MSYGELEAVRGDEPEEKVGRAHTSEGEIFGLLKNDRRRQVVSLLAEGRGAVSISDLARVIADLESDEVPSKKLYKSVYVSLQQTHLPRLARNGVVEYDRSTGTVSAGPELENVLMYTHRRSPSGWWSKEFLIGLAGLLVAAGAMFNLPFVSGTATVMWAVALFSAIICLNLYQIAIQRTKPIE